MAYGIVESPTAACVSDRTVRISMRIDGSYELIDTDRTSRKGFWSGGGREGITSRDSRARVTRKNIGLPGHRHICGADTVTWD